MYDKRQRKYNIFIPIGWNWINSHSDKSVWCILEITEMIAEQVMILEDLGVSTSSDRYSYNNAGNIWRKELVYRKYKVDKAIS